MMKATTTVIRTKAMNYGCDDVVDDNDDDAEVEEYCGGNDKEAADKTSS